METPTVNVQGSLINPSISIWKGFKLCANAIRHALLYFLAAANFKCPSILIPFARSTNWTLVTKEWAGTFRRVIKKEKDYANERWHPLLCIPASQDPQGKGVSNGLQCEVWKGLRPNNIPDQCFQDGVLFILQWKMATATAGGKQSKDHPPLKNETCQQVIKNSRALQ